jgi:hypothetical protein
MMGTKLALILNSGFSSEHNLQPGDAAGRRWRMEMWELGCVHLCDTCQTSWLRTALPSIWVYQVVCNMTKSHKKFIWSQFIRLLKVRLHKDRVNNNSIKFFTLTTEEHQEVAWKSGKNTSSENSLNENWFQLPSIFLINIQPLHRLEN